jgi:serine protease Do
MQFMTGYTKESKKSFTHRLALTAFACLVFGLNAGASFAQSSDANKITTERLSASFAEVSKRVEPAVVNIDTKGKIQETVVKGNGNSGGGNSGSSGGSGNGSGDDNADDILDYLKRQQQRPSASIGSGFIVDKTGYILTNNHVVDDASRITVRLQSGEEFPAKVIGTDEETDLAVLKIDAGRDLPFIKIGNSDSAEVGDWVLAIGSPFGLEQTVTAGIISKTRRETPYASAFQKFIQTDAAINRGNSGGPLVNMDGEVIGINSQIATSTGDYNGIGFALPSNEAANVYRQIVKDGKVRRGYLGVILDSVKAEFAKVYGLTEAKGAIVTDVRDKSSAAANAGLLANDIIVEFNGAKVANAQDLIEKVAATEPNKEVSVVYLREIGTKLERKTTTIKLAERPSNSVASTDDAPKKLTIDAANKKIEPFGLTLIEMSPQLAAIYKLEGEKGLIIKQINQASFIADVKNSSGTDSALNEGDVIQRINRVAVPDVKTFNDIAGNLKKGDAVVMHILSYNRLTRTAQQRIVQFTVQ